MARRAPGRRDDAHRGVARREPPQNLEARARARPAARAPTSRWRSSRVGVGPAARQRRLADRRRPAASTSARLPADLVALQARRLPVARHPRRAVDAGAARRSRAHRVLRGAGERRMVAVSRPRARGHRGRRDRRRHGTAEEAPWTSSSSSASFVIILAGRRAVHQRHRVVRAEARARRGRRRLGAGRGRDGPARDDDPDHRDPVLDAASTRRRSASGRSSARRSCSRPWRCS